MTALSFSNAPEAFDYMATLDGDLRRLLEKAVIAARDIADIGAKAALQRLAVDADQPFEGLSPDERELRRRLRAQARQFGGFGALVHECAYEHWHRMLFARFLAENSLLMHPTGVPVTLEECDELATDENAADGWELAARYASGMLPQIFRTDDPLLEVAFAPEHEQKLEKALGDLPTAVFTADDSLGWVYQYWQSKKKDEVNASEEKIDGATIGPITQLFTEHYMVQFLLHNTLGAWWVCRHPGEELPVEMPYLRLLDDGTPAAGTFDDWPDEAKDIRVLDPCCGSGHFLVAAFEYVRRFRMAEESLSDREAGDRVLQDNIFGLELDARCTQLTAFALALVAWKRGGYRELPELNVACSGTRVSAALPDWLELAGDDEQLRSGTEQLYRLFQRAPDLGSLINPLRTGEISLFAPDAARLQPLLQQAMKSEKVREDNRLHALGVAAQGIARAVELLGRQYHLVTTNVPYLKRGSQANVLADFIEANYEDGKQDIATAFLMRCLEFCHESGICALVTPQNWRFLVTYEGFRQRLLRDSTFDVVCVLGPGAFRAISGEVVNVGLFIITNTSPSRDHHFAGLDSSKSRDPEEKARLLRESPVVLRPQAEQLRNPDARILLEEIEGGPLLEKFADSLKGITTGDDLHYRRNFWELPSIQDGWVSLQSTVDRTHDFGGREHMLWIQEMREPQPPGVYMRGTKAWGKCGVCVSQMRTLPATLYSGDYFDTNVGVILPRNPDHLSAIWAFCSSPDFAEAVRAIDDALKVTNATLAKVPFDLEYWQELAEEAGPPPEPYSEDPTQWLFKGNPAQSTNPLHVAVARLLGYEWSEQDDDHGLGSYIDTDGIACLPAVSGERPAVDRLRALLAAAYGKEWTPAKEGELLAEAGCDNKTLAEWLRDNFFEQHCQLFHHRPFIWHIWDGRRDGFSVLVNYHKLDGGLLERLTYTYLGDWIRRQRHANRQGEQGADARLVAAEALEAKLKFIIAGEPPYDIFVRWKPLHEQPIGWQPDLNDGVRLNIRPFMEAGVLRSKPNIKWGKDRGKNPPGAPFGEERHNDKHFTNAEKHEARREAGLE